MGKVAVPQFLADWFEEEKCRFMSCFDLLSLIRDLKKEDNQLVYNWCNLNQTRYVESILAEMWLYGYEIKEDAKYYWRKKKEYFLDFEHGYEYVYINLDMDDNSLLFDNNNEYNCFKTKFTETEIKKLVGEEDFSKLEKVEVD